MRETPHMLRPDIKRVLWENVAGLMRKRWQGENLTRLARESGCGPGTATRLKECQTSVGVDVLEKIAGVFDLEPWQLLVPGLDPAQPPTLQPFSDEERALYERLVADVNRLAQLKK